MNNEKFYMIFGSSLILLIFSGVLFLYFNHIDRVEKASNWCENAGGFPVIGDDGLFKVCIDSDAVIEPTQ